MPEVNVEINGRKYRMACEEGQEEHLIGLAAKFDSHVEQFKGTFGEIGDNRLSVMAGIAVLDQLEEAKAQIQDAENRVAQARAELDRAVAKSAELEMNFAKKLAETARKIEAVATVVDETGATSR